eukprot:7418211-Ditylum_brightwellii.AAC.1
MNGLDFIKTHLDDVLMIMSDTLDDHLRKLTLVLAQLWGNGLNAFGTTEIEYLGYWITQDGI